MEKQQVQQKPWYKQLWPWLLMIGPVWVVIGGAVMVWLAVRTPDALVVDDYYKRGKAINQDLRRDQLASQMQVALEADYSPARGTLDGSLAAGGKPLGATVHLQLVHPTQPAKDLKLDLHAGADGRFSVPLPELERAHWDVIVEGPQRDWRLTGEWHWPEQRAISLRPY